MKVLLCQKMFAPSPPPTHTPTPTSTSTLPSWYHNTIAAFIFVIQNCLRHPDSLEGTLIGSQEGHMSVHVCSGQGHALEPSTHLRSRLRRRVFPLLEQSLRFRCMGPLLLFSTRMRAWISVFIWNSTMVLTRGLWGQQW